MTAKLRAVPWSVRMRYLPPLPRQTSALLNRGASSRSMFTRAEQLLFFTPSFSLLLPCNSIKGLTVAKSTLCVCMVCVRACVCVCMCVCICVCLCGLYGAVPLKHHGDGCFKHKEKRTKLAVSECVTPEPNRTHIGQERITARDFLISIFFR